MWLVLLFQLEEASFNFPAQSSRPKTQCVCDTAAAGSDFPEKPNSRRKKLDKILNALGLGFKTTERKEEEEEVCVEHFGLSLTRCTF